MQTDAESIREYFTGYLDVVQNNGYSFLYRFGKAQREFYEKEGGYFGAQSRYSAGIKLSALKCTEVSFEINCISSDKELYSVGVIHNGTEENYMFSKGESSIELTFDSEEVTVYFPYDAEIGIKNIKINGIPGKTGKNILSFGDSITQGYMLTESAAAYPSELGRRFDADVYNFGIGGYFIRSGILNELDCLPQPYMVTFAYGTNDWHFENDYTRDLPEIFLRLHEKYDNIPVFVILPIARKSEKTEITKLGTLAQVREVIAAEAEKYDNFYVLNCGGKINPDDDLYTDGIHPNNSGMRKLGKYLTDEIKINL